MPERPIIARAQAAGTPPARRRRPVEERRRPAARRRRGARPRTRNLAGLNQFLERAREQGAAMVVGRARAGRGDRAGRARAGLRGRLRRGHRTRRGGRRRAARDGRAARRTQVREAREEALASCERDLVELAFQIAEKVVRQRVAADPDATVGVLEHALRKAFVRDGLTVLCNPDDLERLSGASELLQTRVGSLTRAQPDRRPADLAGRRRRAHRRGRHRRDDRVAARAPARSAVRRARRRLTREHRPQGATPSASAAPIPTGSAGASPR